MELLGNLSDRIEKISQYWQSLVEEVRKIAGNLFSKNLEKNTEEEEMKEAGFEVRPRGNQISLVFYGGEYGDYVVIKSGKTLKLEKPAMVFTVGGGCSLEYAGKIFKNLPSEGALIISDGTEEGN